MKEWRHLEVQGLGIVSRIIRITTNFKVGRFHPFIDHEGP
jgi:hypothetical protein